ncbi:MAG: hypothetical protein KKG60_02855 [Nanoarchaeota archaeon]|nr:hypothetical protein [Nanoarchaeota archaeon]
MELVACLSTGKGTWAQVSQLIKQGDWTKIYLITNEFGKENFTKDQKTELIPINDKQEVNEMRDEIITKLRPLIKTPEVAVNITSGTGKEHTALITALLKLGLSIRFYTNTKSGVEEI